MRPAGRTGRAAAARHDVGRIVRAGMGRFRRSLGAALVAVVVTGGFGSAAHAEKRVALVIGNAAYENLPRLDKPENDAADIKAALEARGFSVVFGVDLDLVRMKALIERFSAMSQQADVSLVYYSGHGFQVGGVNVLAPVDFKGPESVAGGTIAIQELLANLDRGKGAPTGDTGPIHLIFLDACRNNPLKGRPGAESLAMRDGLAPVPKRPNFLLAYATLPDSFSYEGEGGRNSFYAKAFLTHVNTPGQSLGKFMLQVRNDVFRQTGGVQSPVEENALLRDFVFADGPEDLANLETQLWQFASATENPRLLETYLSRYPAGPHAADARARMREVSAVRVAGGGGLVRSLVVDEEQRLWALASRLRDRGVVQEYLRRFPNGPNAPSARILQDGLSDTAEESAGAQCARLATHERDGTEAVRGIAWERLKDQADAAVKACQSAMSQRPDDPIYKTLLARALSAAGRQADSIPLYQAAAKAGNARAMVSLGLALKEGASVPKDEQAALDWFERAAELGFEDGVINLTNALIQDPRRRDRNRAVELLRKAADRGSAKATFNLAVLADADKRFANAATLFEQAGDLGYAEGYTIAAAYFDSRTMGPIRDPDRAARLILKAAAADDGTFVLKFVLKSYTAETQAALIQRLRAMGRLAGAKPTDAAVKDALKAWSAFGSNLKTASR
jgi:TPR repeat protein